jgi:hypothetical protein
MHHQISQSIYFQQYHPKEIQRIHIKNTSAKISA